MTRLTIITKPEKSCSDNWSFSLGAWFTREVSSASLCTFQLLYWILSKFKGLTKLTANNCLDATGNCLLAAAAVRVCWHNQFLKLAFLNSICGKGMDSDGQESVSARGVYENIYPYNINPIPLIYLDVPVCYFISLWAVMSWWCKISSSLVHHWSTLFNTKLMCSTRQQEHNRAGFSGSGHKQLKPFCTYT